MDISLISKKVWQNLKIKPKLIRDRPCVKSVSKDSLKIEGCANITFKIGNLTLTHKFYVVNGMNRNMILGRDWIKQKGVRLYFDLGYLRIGKTYVRLEEDIHISSLLRLCKQTTLAPISVTIL